MGNKTLEVRINNMLSVLKNKNKLDMSLSIEEQESIIDMWMIKQSIARKLGLLSSNQLNKLDGEGVDWSGYEVHIDNFLNNIPPLFSSDLDSDNTSIYCKFLLALSKELGKNTPHLPNQIENGLDHYKPYFVDFLSV